MPIKVVCPVCQQALVAKDEHAGRSCNCPKCKHRMTIPAATIAAPLVNAAATAQMHSSRTAATSATLPAQTTSAATTAASSAAEATCPSCKKPFALDKIVCIECGYSRRLKRRMKTAKDEPTPSARPTAWSKPTAKPTKQKVAKPRKPIFSVDGGKMFSGLGMMGGATVWFVAGWMAGRIFFYPPVLFVFGFVAFINGLFGEDGTW